MNAVFLSASVPVIGRGTYHETANPFLIQFAVRELVIAVIREQTIVWGGHPAITPMIWSICNDMSADYSKSVVLYQSKFFQDQFPEENDRFQNVEYTDSVPNDRAASLQKMRESMLSRSDLKAAVFIGGMEGVETEFNLFKSYHPNAKVLPIASSGGAALQLAKNMNIPESDDLYSVNFAKIFHSNLASPPPNQQAQSL